MMEIHRSTTDGRGFQCAPKNEWSCLHKCCTGR